MPTIFVSSQYNTENGDRMMTAMPVKMQNFRQPLVFKFHFAMTTPAIILPNTPPGTAVMPKI